MVAGSVGDRLGHGLLHHPPEPPDTGAGTLEEKLLPNFFQICPLYQGLKSSKFSFEVGKRLSTGSPLCGGAAWHHGCSCVAPARLAVWRRRGARRGVLAFQRRLETDATSDGATADLQ